MHRKIRVFAIVVLVAALGIAGCSKGGGTTPPPVTDKGPKYGGTLVIALPADPTSFNNGVGQAGVTQSCGTKIFSGLVAWDDQYRPIPDLAESWDISDGGKTYTFHLRKGVTWHDGKPFSSADVLCTFQEILSKHNPAISELIKSVGATFSAPDANTFVIKMNTTSPTILSMLQNRDAPILPAHLYQGTDILKNPANQQPIGTGPYKFKEHKMGSQVVLVRNDKYYKNGRPFLDGIVFQIVPDSSVAAMMFERGEIQYIGAVNVPRSAAIGLLKKPGIHELKGQSPASIVNLFFNTVSGNKVTDPKVRQAISIALDRRQIIDLGQDGLGTPEYSCIPAQYSWAVNPDVKQWYSYNPTLADKMLDEAGCKKDANGIRFKIRLIYEATNVNVEKPAEVIKAQLAKVGITVELVRLERSLLLQAAFTNYDFDMYIHNYSTQGDPALGIARAYVTSSIVKGATFNNCSRYSNPKVDELWTAGASLTDTAARQKAYYDLQVLIANDMPTATLFSRADIGLGSDKLVGLGWRPDDTNMDFAWLAAGTPAKAGSYWPLEPDLQARIDAGVKN